MSPARTPPSVVTLRRLLATLWPVLDGSVVVLRRPCTRPRCRRCASGAKHPATYLSLSRAGKTELVYLPAALVRPVGRGVANYRRLLHAIRDRHPPVGRGSQAPAPAPAVAPVPEIPFEGAALRTRLHHLLTVASGPLRRSVRTNLTILTEAFLLLVRGGRSGQGRLSLHAIARHVAIPGRPASRYKRLHRFLDCRSFDPVTGTTALVRLAVGARPHARLLPVIGDQTRIGTVEVLHLGTPYRGRVLPLGFRTWTYPLAKGSQPHLERIALADVATGLPAAVRPVWVLDRGYARVRLIQELTRVGELFIIRGLATVGVGQGGRWRRLRALAAGLPPRVAVRFTHVLYHRTRQQPVDVVCYRDPEFQEPWMLVLPPDSERLLPTGEAVQCYRARMQIEQGHRAWQTHLGVRGLRLKARRADRLAP